MKIDVSDLNRADVLAALYNRAQPQGMGFLHFNPSDMTREGAESLIAEVEALDRHDVPYFDYVKGRVMKIRLSDAIDPRLYDRDNGEGGVAGVIDQLRAGGL